MMLLWHYNQAITWNLDKLEAFLLKALLFPKSLRLIEVIVAGTTVLSLQRECSTAQTLSIPAGLLRETPNRLFSAGD
eukprot:15427-Heterococcus_DN1.PRE.3